MKPVFFRSPVEMRAWFAKHAGTADELHVGYYKKGSGEPGITWSESVDEALCVGWIDGISRTVDGRSHTKRFTPRKKGGIWSAVNIRKAGALIAEGRMQPVGMKAFEARRENRSGIYSYEQRTVDLPEPYRGSFRANTAAWKYFQDQPPGYRKKLIWWVVSAKQETTRLRRLEKLVTESASGRRWRE